MTIIKHCSVIITANMSPNSVFVKFYSTSVHHSGRNIECCNGTIQLQNCRLKIDL